MKKNVVRTISPFFIFFLVLTSFIAANAFARNYSGLTVLREGAQAPVPSRELMKERQPWKQNLRPLLDATGTQTIDFEDGSDGEVIQSGIPGVTFSTTDRQDWLYGDKRTGNYNVDPYGTKKYRCNGNFFAWLGPNQGQGRIDFTQGIANRVTVKYSSYSTVHLDAYSATGALLDSDTGSGNLDAPMGTLSVSAASISYVIFHDSGNYWLIDDVEITLEDIELISVNIPDSNKGDHNADDYEDLVLRRGGMIDVLVETSAGYDEEYHTIGLSVQLPGGTKKVVPQKNSGEPTEWYATQTGINRPTDKTEISFDLHVPGNAPIGKYKLEANLSQSNGGTILGTKECPDDFYIIFNPWSDEDTDVYQQSMVSQLGHYVLGGTDWNYYGRTDAEHGSYDHHGHYVGSAKQWTMGVTDSKVFKEALEDITRETSASNASRLLRLKVQYNKDAGDPSTDIITGRWGDGWYKCDWRNVPDIINHWLGHPTGQCMDFAGTLTALQRAVGIPARMLTCVASGGWNFHAWSETILNEVVSGNWSAVDGTPMGACSINYPNGFGPSSRRGELFACEVDYYPTTAVYTYDASSATRADIKGHYGIAGAAMTLGHTMKALGDTDISITAENTPYLIGDEARIVVTVTNTGTTALNTPLNFSVVQEFYNGTTRALPVFAARNISVPAGGSISETYTISRETYEYQGTYKATASTNDASGEGYFDINDGLEVLAGMVSVAGDPELYDITATVRNILTRSIDDLQVEVYFPGSADVASNPITFGPMSLTSGEEVSQTWRVRFTERGQTGVVCYANSEEAGYDKSNADENVRGDAKILCSFDNMAPIFLADSVTVNARVTNIGGVTTDVDVEFFIPDSFEMAASRAQSSQTLYNVTPGEERLITFDVTPEQAGKFAIVMKTEDSNGVSDVAAGPITVSESPRDIAVSVDPENVMGDEKRNVNLIIENLTSFSDDVIIISRASNEGILYAIFDGTTRILGQSVNLPPDSTKTLDIEIQPSNPGDIYVTCTSIHDPLASDSARIGISASVTRGDFNGDGKADILWRNDSSGEVYIWLMNGTSIGSQGSSGTVADLNWKIQKVGDYTGDGKADILWRHNTTGELSVWVMDGITRLSGGTPGWVTTDWQVKDVGDFNGDGKADFLWRNDSSGEVYVWLMNGTSIGSQGSSGKVSDLNWKIQFVGDYTGDGKADILWRHNTTGELSVWVMDGITRLSGGTPGWVTTDWQVKDVGDFNGDGKADILWRNDSSGEVYIWLMNGTSIGSQGSSGKVSDLNWTIQKVGDYTGDGKADILWRHNTTGELSVWVMDGITRLSGGTPGWVTTDWQIK